MEDSTSIKKRLHASYVTVIGGYPRAARLSDVSTQCVADTLGAEAFSLKFEHL